MNGYTGELVVRARVAQARAFGDQTPVLATLHKAGGVAFYAGGTGDGADDDVGCRIRVDLKALDNQVSGNFRLCLLETSSNAHPAPLLTPLTPVGAASPVVPLAAKGTTTAYYDMPRGTPTNAGPQTYDGTGVIEVGSGGDVVGQEEVTHFLSEVAVGDYVAYADCGGPGYGIVVSVTDDETMSITCLPGLPYPLNTSAPNAFQVISSIGFDLRQLVCDFESSAGNPPAEVLVKAKPYCFPGWKQANLTGPAALRAEPGVVNSAMGRAAEAGDYQFEIDAAKDMIARRLAGDGIDLDMIPTDGVVLLDAAGPQEVAKYLVPELTDAATYLALHLIHVRFLSHTDDFDAVKADRYARMFEDAYDQSIKTLPINVAKGLELTPEDQARGVDVELEL